MPSIRILRIVQFAIIGLLLSPELLNAQGSDNAPVGLVAHWSLDEESGTTAIDAVSTHDADFIGQPEWTAGKIGYALAFDGRTDELAVPPIELGDGTIAAWVKWNTKSVLMAGSGYQEGYWLHFEEGSNLVKINWGGKYRSFRDVFEVGEWTHVAMTREGSVLRLYKNGELTETVQSGGTRRATIRGIGALYAQSGAYQHFDGLLDDVRIYDRSLSMDEIKDLHGSETLPEVPENQPPSISLIVPGSDVPLTSPASILLEANASDADGSISKVEFYAGSTNLGSVTSEPFQLAVSDLQAGTYYLQAVAYDNTGETATSPTISLSVSEVVNDAANDDIPGLIARWSLDQQSGTTAIDAASTHDAEFIGEPEWTAGKLGHALAFDGRTDELAVPPIDLGDGTISAWVRWNTKSVLMAGSGYQEGYWLHFDEGSSLVKINWGGRYRSFRDVFEVGEWTHVAMTREGSVLRLYKNGELTETVESGSTNRATIRGIGALYAESGAFQRFDGLLDEVRIYDRALSTTEIQVLHGSESTTETSEPPAEESEETQDGTFNYSVVLYAGPNGSGAADGSHQNPFTIKQALDAANPQTEAILLKAGTYPGPHFYSHEFSRSTPLVVRSAPGGLAVLDGAFTRSGGGIRWQDIEFAADGWPDRQTTSSGSEPSDMPDLGFTITARDEFVNSIIHDHSNNGFWSTAENLLVYGCLFYNQGWNAPDRGHGHAAYMQNLNGTKSFERNVLVRGFSRQTIQAYGSSNASLRGFNFKENVSIGGRWLVGGGSPVARLSMTGNHIQGVAQLGYGTSVVNEDATLTGNVLSQQVARVGGWLDYSESGTLFSDGLDEVFVYDNVFDPDRGLVVVYNAALKPSVSIDLTSLPLTTGHTYRFINALNPAEGHEFVYDEQSVTLPMSIWSVAIPTAWDAALVDASFPSFGAFFIVGADRYTSSPKLAAAIQESDEHSILPGDSANEVAGEFVLDRIYPNPFNPSTTIPFSLTVQSEVDISVYDVMGREIAILARGSHSAGDHMVRFDASGLPSGVYLVRARVRGSMGRVHVLSRMITLLK